MQIALLSVVLAAAGPAPDAFHPSAAALAVVRALDLGPPKRGFKKITVEGVAVFKNKSSPLREEIAVLGLPSPGLMDVRQSTPGDADFQVRTSVNDIAVLSFKSYLQSPHKAPDLAASSESLTFFGDWKRKPLGGRFGYRSRQVYYDAKTGVTPAEPYDETCRVLSEGPAKVLFPTLQGVAKRLTCETTHHGRTDTTEGAYLEDYQWFVRLSSQPNAFYYFKQHIVSVE